MKKVVLSAIAVFALSFANAQKKSVPTKVEKNNSAFGFSNEDYIIEGAFSFSSTSGSAEDTNTFSFSPSVGYFIKKNLAVGGRLSYKTSKTEESGGVITDKSSAFRIEGFLRHYFFDFGNRFKLYGDYSLGFESGKMGTANNKYTGFGIAAGLGMNFFVTEKIALNVGLADVLSVYSMSPDKGDNITKIEGNVNVFNNFFTQTQFGLTFKY